jgi:hypothetical protein
MEPRLKSSLWVAATLRTADISGSPGMVLRKGDSDAGGILVVLRTRSGLSVFSQARTADGEPGWTRATGAEPVTDETADAYVARRIRSDPDLWVVEFETTVLSLPFQALVIGDAS